MEKKNPGIWIAAAVALAMLAVFLATSGKKSPSLPGMIGAGSALPRPGAAQSAPATHPQAAVAPPPPATTTPPNPKPVPRPVVDTKPDPLPELPAATREQVQQSLDNLQFAFRDYRTQLGGNPVGNNAEITRALLGDNLKQLKLPIPDGSRVNAAGEMCDHWGRPYFFHQLSKDKMEIRSAGPDGRMWTADDLHL